MAGMAFFVAAGLFLWTTIAVYNKDFVRTVQVTLITDSAGNALARHADVKVRGVNVGQVRASSSERGQVVLDLAIDPGKAGLIPANASARLLPKTLFGERYVALVIPADPSPARIRRGANLALGSAQPFAGVRHGTGRGLSFGLDCQLGIGSHPGESPSRSRKTAGGRVEPIIVLQPYQLSGR